MDFIEHDTFTELSGLIANFTIWRVSFVDETIFILNIYFRFAATDLAIYVIKIVIVLDFSFQVTFTNYTIGMM